jgi:hypothetical protein
MSTEELLARVDYMSDIINPALNLRTAAQIELDNQRFNNNHKLVAFKSDSYVMIKVPGKTTQLAPSYAGPYKVVRQHKGGSYLLRDETGVLMPRDYAPYELKEVSKEELIQGDSNTETSYEVEAIIDHRGNEDQHEYLVRWKNYSSDWDQWLKPEKFNDTEVIRKYWKRMGVAYKPKKGNVITNAPTSAINNNVGNSDVQLGTVARIYKSIERDIDEIYPIQENNVTSLPTTPVNKKVKLNSSKHKKPRATNSLNKRKHNLMKHNKPKAPTPSRRSSRLMQKHKRS